MATLNPESLPCQELKIEPGTVDNQKISNCESKDDFADERDAASKSQRDKKEDNRDPAEKKFMKDLFSKNIIVPSKSNLRRKKHTKETQNLLHLLNF